MMLSIRPYYMVTRAFPEGVRFNSTGFTALHYLCSIHCDCALLKENTQCHTVCKLFWRRGWPSALKKAISKQVLIPFKVCTYLLEVANPVNQHLIRRFPGDPDDRAYLSPNDICFWEEQSQRYHKVHSSTQEIHENEQSAYRD